MGGFDVDAMVRRARERGPSLTHRDAKTGDYYSVPVIEGSRGMDRLDEVDDDPSPGSRRQGSGDGPPSDLVDRLISARNAKNEAEREYDEAREALAKFLGEDVHYEFLGTAGTVRVQLRPIMRVREGVSSDELVRLVDGLGLLPEMATIPSTRLWKYYQADQEFAQAIDPLVEQDVTPYFRCLTLRG